MILLAVVPAAAAQVAVAVAVAVAVGVGVGVAVLAGSRAPAGLRHSTVTGRNR